MSHPSLFFSKIVRSLQGPLWYQMTLRVSVPVFIEKQTNKNDEQLAGRIGRAAGISIGVVLNLQSLWAVVTESPAGEGQNGPSQSKVLQTTDKNQKSAAFYSAGVKGSTKKQCHQNNAGC